MSPFLTPGSTRSAAGGGFTSVSAGLVASTGVAVASALRVDGWRKSSSEHERAGVLQRAEQTKTYCCLVIILHYETAGFMNAYICETSPKTETATPKIPEYIAGRMRAASCRQWKRPSSRPQPAQGHRRKRDSFPFILRVRPMFMFPCKGVCVRYVL